MRRLIALATAAIFVLVVGMASADEVTRESYTAEVEPICKAQTKSTETILKGVKQKVKSGKLSAAGTQFTKAAAVAKSSYGELQGVPQPTADSAKLTKWLGYIKTEADLFKQIGEALKAGKETKAQQLIVKVTHTGNQANVQVLAFSFKYCVFDSSKFS